MRRDFTYVDDIVEAIVRLVDRAAAAESGLVERRRPIPARAAAPWRVYNIGNNKPVELLEVVRLLEEAIGKKAKRELLPMQPGDVPATYADVDDLMRDVGFQAGNADRARALPASSRGTRIITRFVESLRHGVAHRDKDLAAPRFGRATADSRSHPLL